MGKIKIVFIVVGILVLPLGIFAWSGGLNWLTAPFRGAIEQREQIQASGDFRIFSYNHFYDACRSIQQAESEYDNQYDVLGLMDKSEDGYDRQRRTVAILRAQIEQLKQEYNADSAKEETQAAFKSNNLPYRLLIQPHEYGNRTNCQF